MPCKILPSNVGNLNILFEVLKEYLISAEPLSELMIAVYKTKSIEQTQTVTTRNIIQENKSNLANLCKNFLKPFIISPHLVHIFLINT